MSDAFETAEAGRRLAHVILAGLIVEVDHGARRAVVEIEDDWRSAPLPWLERRSGALRTSSPPTVDEPCLVLCPSGETAAGLILLGAPSDAARPSETREGLELVEVQDGYRDAYDADTATRTIDAPTRVVVAIAGQARVTAEAEAVTLTIGGVELKLAEGRVSIKGDLAVTGVTALDGSVTLGGADGGQPVARVGDAIDVNTRKIIAGSARVKAL